MRREAGLTLFFSPALGVAASSGGGRPDVGMASRASRPDADAIAAIAAASGQAVPFAISHRPHDHPYWVELLALGLTFDLRGLAPGVGAQVVPPIHAFGLPLEDAQGLEVVVLRPGPHLASAGALLPIVRTMAALGCELAALPGLSGIGWEPAGTIMSPEYFRRTAGAWLEGGAFPALGFTALSRNREGAMCSVGLGVFAGHELSVEPAPGDSPADLARLAVRVIHDLVQNGPYSAGVHEGPGGEFLHCSYNADRTQLRIRREQRPDS